MNSHAALVHAGYREARLVTNRHARSFSFASIVMLGARRRAAFALYSFCRRLDDLVDDGGQSGLEERLQAARARVSALYASSTSSSLTEAAGPWPAHEFAALRDTIERFNIPQQPLQDLISGMEMDLVKTRYANYSELDLYCYRVAGTVGLMMTPVLGCEDDRALGPAAELGKAMQLTNILRDIGEDLARGRIYLPGDELTSFGVTEDNLRAGIVDKAFIEFMRFQISRARSLYERSAVGIRHLNGFGAQRMVRLMGALYSGILTVIEHQQYDVFRTRARVSMPSKLATLARVMVTPGRVLPGPALPQVST